MERVSLRQQRRRLINMEEAEERERRRLEEEEAALRRWRGETERERRVRAEGLHWSRLAARHTATAAAAAAASLESCGT